MFKFLSKTFVPVFASFLLLACSTPTATNNSQDFANDASKSLPATQSEMSKNGSYITYESYAQEAEKFKNTKVIMFFNAAWCSTCKIARDNFESSLNSIPADLTIVVVDFDNSNDLRKKYGVTVQHTFVQIDQNGDSLKKWSGSTTIEELIEVSI